MPEVVVVLVLVVAVASAEDRAGKLAVRHRASAHVDEGASNMLTRTARRVQSQVLG